MSQTTLNPDGFAQVGDLQALGVPFKPSTIWEKVRKSEFPAPYKLSPRCTAWRIGDIIEWQRAQAGKQPTDNAKGRELTAARQAKAGE
ncbi:MAG: AlpA family phage regulatory protein [Zoogloeaceae bacterium]|nr:AlpA family phage regulatory protein [Zoogloeaceae bacterium]